MEGKENRKGLALMPNVRSSHPSPDQLAAFDGGALPPNERTAIEQHIDACAICCERLDALPDDPLVALIRSPEPLATTSTQTLNASSMTTPLALSAIAET